MSPPFGCGSHEITSFFRQGRIPSSIIGAFVHALSFFSQAHVALRSFPKIRQVPAPGLITTFTPNCPIRARDIITIPTNHGPLRRRRSTANWSRVNDSLPFLKPIELMPRTSLRDSILSPQNCPHFVIRFSPLPREFSFSPLAPGP